MTYHVIKSTNSIHNTTDNLFLAALSLGLGDNLLVTYDGHILATGANSTAVYLNGYAESSNITVNGLIFGTSTGIHSLGTYAHITVNGQVQSDGTAIRIANSGTVYVSATGLVSGGSEGIAMSGSTLVNNGTVHGSGNNAIQMSSGRITNNGLISSDLFGIFFGADGAGSITNTGTIVGDLTTWYGASNAENDLTIENSGQWSGGLGLTPGNDEVTNTGRISGSVSLGDGDDIFDSRYGFIGGEISGGAGADTIRTGAEDNTISGGAGGDFLDGGGGINTVSYQGSQQGVRVDLLNGVASGGDAAGDTLFNFQNVTGSLNKDKLTGDNNANVLNGVLGNDVLIGNGGNDVFTLFGGTITGADSQAKLNGGAGNDVFQLFSLAPDVYGRALSAGSTIIGGGGFDTLELRNVGSSVTFASSTVSGVERIVVKDGFSYGLTTHNATVAAEQTLEVDGSGLTGSNKLNFNGSAESDGSFVIYGGNGADMLRGGALGDVLNGGARGDTLTGGAGADIFEYESNLDSSFSQRDSLVGFNAAEDKFRLNVPVTGIDATVSGSVSNASDLATLLNGKLLAQHAILANITAGALAGTTLLVVDGNDKAGFQSGADFVMNVSGMTGTLTKSNFLLG